MTQEILQALRNIEDKIMRAQTEPVATMHKSETETIFSKGWVPSLMGFTSQPLYAAHSDKEPTAFNWTPSMDAIWPKDMRPTMSGLLAIWAAMHDAAVYTSVPGPTEPKDDAEGWIEWEAKGGNNAKGPDIPDDTIVEVKLMGGWEPRSKGKLPVKDWTWGDRGMGSISAYRVVSP